MIRKMSVKILALFTMLGILCLPLAAAEEPAPQHFLASNSYLEFEITSRSNAQWIFGERITLQRTQNGADGLKLRASEIPDPLIGYLYLSVDDGVPQKLGKSWIDVVPDKADYSEIQVLISPDIVMAPLGTYPVHLEANGQKMLGIDLQIKVGSHVAILAVTPSQITIEATNGPGRYFAKVPVEVQIEYNNPNWEVLLSTEGAFYADNHEMKVSPRELMVAINDREAEYESFEHDSGTLGIWLEPESFVGGIATLHLAADIGFQHRAGSYDGKISVTLLPAGN